MHYICSKNQNYIFLSPWMENSLTYIFTLCSTYQIVPEQNTHNGQPVILQTLITIIVCPAKHTKLTTLCEKNTKKNVHSLCFKDLKAP